MVRERKLSIMVVDDDEGHTELVRRNLVRSGVTGEFIAVGNGTEALNYIFRRGNHAGRTTARELLVLLDINMPGIDGVEVLRQIKGNPLTRRIPVIMLTTTDDPREIDLCYDLGCNFYLTKPVEPAAFVDAIHRLGSFISVVSVPADPAGVS